MKVKKMLYLFMFLLSFLIYTPVHAESSIHIEDVKIVGQRGEVVVGDLNYHDNTIESSFTFNNVNDFVILDVTVKNDDEIAYQLQDIESSFSRYLSTETNAIDQFVEAGETKRFQITIIYDKLAINQDVITLNDSTMTLRYVETIKNPETSFHFLSLIFLVFVICLFPVMFFRVKKRFMVLIFLIVPFMVFAFEEKNIEVLIRQVTVKGQMMEYTITVDDGEGNVQRVTRTYGQTIDDLDPPTRDGYVFSHWEDDKGNPVDEDTVVENDMNIVATYEPVHYSITYVLNDGTVNGTNPSSYTIEDEFTLINPTKEGAVFAGWSEGDSEEKSTTYILHAGTFGDKVFTANWTVIPIANYTVVHKKMNVQGNYNNLSDDDIETETFQADVGSTVTPATKTYTGFEALEPRSEVVSANGDTVITYEYVRMKYQFRVTNRASYANEELTDPDGEYYYQSVVHAQAIVRNGYSMRWSDDVEDYGRDITITEATTLTILYSPKNNTPYTVNKHFMDLNGEYPDTTGLLVSTTLYGITDGPTSAVPNNVDGFTTPETQEKTISGDGDTVIDYYYVRNQYEVTFTDYVNMVCHEGASSDDDEGPECYSTPSDYAKADASAGLFEYGTKKMNYYYGQTLSLSAGQPSGYSLSWSNCDGEDNKCTFVVPANNTSVGPVYTGQTVDYYVFISVSDSEDGYFEKIDSIDKTGTAGTTVYESPPDLDGYSAVTSGYSAMISGAGDTVFSFHYVRNSVSITFTNAQYLSCSYSDSNHYDDSCFSSSDDEITVSFEYGSNISLYAEREGYNTYWESNLCSNNESEYCSFELTESGLSVGPEFEAKDVSYSVCHNKEKFASDDLFEVRCDTDTGKHDEVITPEPAEFTGFISGDSPSYTLDYDRDENIINLIYYRKKYTLSLSYNYDMVSYCVYDTGVQYDYDTDYGTCTYASASSYESREFYGTMKLASSRKANYSFVQWSNGDTSREIEIYFNQDTEIYPIYELNPKLTIDNYEYVDISGETSWEDAKSEQYFENGHHVYLYADSDTDESPGIRLFYEWQDGDGNHLSYDQSYDFTMNGDTHLRAVYVSPMELTIYNHNYTEYYDENYYEWVDAEQYYSLTSGSYVELRAYNRESDGYLLTGWEGDECTSSDPTHISDTCSFNLTKNTTVGPVYTAFYYFEVPENAEYIEYSSGASYDNLPEFGYSRIFEGVTVSVRLKEAPEGYRFVGWSNGETNETFSFTMNEDYSVYPIFEEDPAYGTSYIMQSVPAMHLNYSIQNEYTSYPLNATYNYAYEDNQYRRWNYDWLFSKSRYNL